MFASLLGLDAIIEVDKPCIYPELWETGTTSYHGDRLNNGANSYINIKIGSGENTLG